MLYKRIDGALHFRAATAGDGLVAFRQGIVGTRAPATQHHVEGVVRLPEIGEGDAVEPAVVLLHERGEGLAVSGGEPRHELPVTRSALQRLHVKRFIGPRPRPHCHGSFRPPVA